MGFTGTNIEEMNEKLGKIEKQNNEIIELLKAIEENTGNWC